VGAHVDHKNAAGEVIGGVLTVVAGATAGAEKAEYREAGTVPYCGPFFLSPDTLFEFADPDSLFCKTI